ncbi:MAG TPA: hypothetical protein VIM08_09665 [Arthrobacter sp.]
MRSRLEINARVLRDGTWTLLTGQLLWMPQTVAGLAAFDIRGLVAALLYQRQNPVS